MQTSHKKKPIAVQLSASPAPIGNRILQSSQHEPIDDNVIYKTCIILKHYLSFTLKYKQSLSRICVQIIIQVTNYAWFFIQMCTAISCMGTRPSHDKVTEWGKTQCPSLQSRGTIMCIALIEWFKFVQLIYPTCRLQNCTAIYR